MYEVTITAEFKTGTTCSTEELAKETAKKILLDLLRQARIAGLDASNLGEGIFSVQIKDVAAESLLRRNK